MIDDIIQLDKKGLRNFGLLTGAIVTILFGILLPWIANFSFPLWPWYLAGVLWILALFIPGALNPIYNLWMRFGMVLGWINTRIILGLVFYLVFTPVSFLLKILNKDPMRRAMESEVQSYRIPSKNQPREQMEKPF
ncbi:MAG: sxtJ [Gammaproteobacteria bacterium SG8_11]|nr:MAG: sxtJ [Gammaproteobacteria bacterium SG8_11]